MSENSNNPMDFAPRPLPKLLLNVGALMDIPTSTFVIGSKGESIMNGGLSNFTAVVGKGNYFKSSVTNYLALSSSDRMRESGLDGTVNIYDTENLMDPNRVDYLASKFPHIPSCPLLDPPSSNFFFTNKDAIDGNEWQMKLFNALDFKAKSGNVKITCFKNPYTGKELEVKKPSFVVLDSMTMFEGGVTSEKVEGTLEDKSIKTIYMEKGQFKTHFTSKIPMNASKTNTFFITTAHFGAEVKIDAPLYGPAPIRDLQHLTQEGKIKGVGSNFFFLTTQIWLVTSASILSNQGTKLAEYPKDENDQDKEDLNIIKMKLLRNKHGGSGDMIELLVSQRDGILPSLSEFHYCKERDRFGLVGNNTFYSNVFLPDVKLSRTTVRSKLDENPLLRRAINITAELLQIKLNMPDYVSSGLWCEPGVLYEDIKNLGYDWNVLLDTRGYWLPDQYSSKTKPFLSTMDLLKMRKGLYEPYFLKDKKK